MIAEAALSAPFDDHAARRDTGTARFHVGSDLGPRRTPRVAGNAVVRDLRREAAVERRLCRARRLALVDGRADLVPVDVCIHAVMLALLHIKRPRVLDDHVHHNPSRWMTWSSSARACELKDSDERA